MNFAGLCSRYLSNVTPRLKQINQKNPLVLEHAYIRHTPRSGLLHTSCQVCDPRTQPTGRAGHITPWLRTPFFHERGPPVGVDMSLQERLDELYVGDGLQGERVDIGFKHEKSGDVVGRAQVADWKRRTRSDKELEKAAREGTLEVDLEVVRKQWVESGSVFDEIYNAAELYGLYEDLYEHGYFKPCTMLDVKYQYKDVLVPVYRGNMVKPREAEVAPQVKFDSSESAQWCLTMVGLDCSMKGEGEVLHWLVGNISGSDLNTGETLCKYLKPFPAFGSGYHRFAFVLYRQEGQIDFSSEAREEEAGVCLESRDFRTLDFYSKYQDQLTPAGLAFFQSDYDSTLREFFHNTLNMREPRYEYEFPDWYVKPWQHFSQTNLKDGFDEFLDRRRDPKDIQREVLEVKLSHTNPFTGDTDAYIKYPGIHEMELREVFPPPVGEKRLNSRQSFKIAQWRRTAIQKQRLKERYFRSSDHKDLRRDPCLTS